MKPETELRELEVWIAVNLFGYIRISAKPHPSDNRAINGDLYSPGGVDCDCGQSSVIPEYTTNPADAMAVFEKCLAKLPRSLEISFDADSPGAGYFISRTDDDASQAVIADTLPLAIAKFARQIFSA